MEDWDKMQSEILEIRKEILKHLSEALASLEKAVALCAKNGMWLHDQQDIMKSAEDLRKIRDELAIPTPEIRDDI